MRKILTKLFVGVLALCLVCSGLIACGTSGWKAGSLTNGGQVINSAGFVAETEHYLYFINGVGSSSADNTFGAPVKGALMAIDKDNLTDASKAEIVVPKLFVAQDYEASLFIDGGYVYYATPNTEKDASGAVASSELIVTRTKLDGSGATEEFVTLPSLSTEYRFVKGGEKVFVVYYDSELKALVSYNITDKAEVVIAKTDDKAKELSLDAYKFTADEDKGDVVVLYTVTIYTEEYSEEKASKDGYTRPTANYNKVYAYKVGDALNGEVAGTLVYDGKNTDSDIDDVKYAFKLVESGYLFYGATKNGTETTYAVKLGELAQAKVGTEIVNADYVADTNIIVDLETVYTVTNGVLYKTTMTAKDNAVKLPVAKADGITTLLAVNGGYAYYYNSSNQIAKIKLVDVQAGETTDGVNEIRVSSDTVSTTWFDPEIMTVEGTEYMFYLDNSSFGMSYVNFIELGADVIEEDTDDDGENDLFYLDTAKINLLAKMTLEDQASIVSAKINKLSSTEFADGAIKLEVVDDKLGNVAIVEAKAMFDAQDKAIKDLVDESVVKTLDNYLEAIKMANVYNKLRGIQNCVTAEDASEFKPVYEQIKAEVEEFKKSENKTVIDGYIEGNLKFYYQKAVSLFAPKTETKK